MARAPTPWWVPWVVGGAFVAFPALVIGCSERVVGSLETYATELEQAGTYESSSSSGESAEYVPPCDVQAVLDALGMNVVQYQAARGLYVDGVVGPQTGAALCAEELPEGGT